MSDVFGNSRPPGSEQGAALVAVPPWDQVSFDVLCPSCGVNLRDQTGSVCPGCGLPLDWNRVLPLDDLRCEKCSYRLLGLPERRCPECGTPFRWRKVLLAARMRGIQLFEFQWFANPVQGFARSTWLATFRPRKLWADYSTRVPPKLIPLLAFMLLQWVVFAWGWRVTAWTIDPTINSVSAWLDERVPVIDRSTGEIVPGPRLTFVYPFRVRPLFLPAMGMWYLTTFVSLQLLFQTKHRLRIRWPETMRVYVHATVFASICTGLWCVLEGLLDSTLFFTRALVGRSQVGYFILAQAVFAIGVIATWVHLWIGLARHLKVPHGWLVSAACLLIGYLTSLSLVP